MIRLETIAAESEWTPARKLLDDFFAGKIYSFRECYEQITGDTKLSGRAEDCNFDRMAMMMVGFTEAVNTSTFTNICQSAVGAAMVAEYRRLDLQSIWRKVATVAARLPDFRVRNLLRVGGYGDLPQLSQGAAYLPLSSPVEDGASYAATKRGGTESLTLEALRNDGAADFIRSIPNRLAQAAERTLARFVLNLLRDNPVIYDGLALFHASHGNLGSGALSAVSLASGYAAIKKQTEPGSNDRLMLKGRYIFAPLELEETGANLLRRNLNKDRFFMQAQGLEVVPVWYWADANDWCLGCDPADFSSVEVAFMDREEPEVIIQDLPDAGSLFSHDQITFKIRHIYGGAVTDYRGLWKAVN